MNYQITHTTLYQYSRSVLLQPHYLRLHPRSDSWQTVREFDLAIDPQPLGISNFTDLDGNHLIKLWFQEVTQHLKIVVRSQVETHQSNPFNFLLLPGAIKLPIDYPSSLLLQLQPYLKPYSPILTSEALQLGQDIYQAVEGDTIAFLTTLNQRINESCQYLVRATGEPWFSGVTWQNRRGSCRDLTVLFMDICRSLGLGARFVSGYHEGDVNIEERDLHAWAEIFLPGAGWRGFDPTLGLVVADRHIALVASAIPSYTAPVDGPYRPAIPDIKAPQPTSAMETVVTVKLKTERD